MTLDAFSRSNCATVEEKVAKISEFIISELETRTLHDLHASGCYTVIARSAKSPVAQALRANAARLAAANISIRAIFCEAGPSAADSKAPFGLSGECRIVRDARLLAAHEQLVLAPDRAWIGDCMRREPSKRDTYERFSTDAPDVAALASRSFERLWRAAVPMCSIPRMSPALASHLRGTAGTPLARSESFRRQ